MTATVEVELLDEQMLAADIPCQMLRNYDPCGRPSVARTKQHCSACDIGIVIFVCDLCLDILKLGLARCIRCNGETIVLDAVL